jgi:hypothetical protein
MAIVVESGQKKGGITKIIIWLMLLGVVLFGVYYLFFKRPDVIPNLVAPASFQQASELSGVKLDPGAVVQSPAFQDLRPQAPEMPVPAAGRENPFAPI